MRDAAVRADWEQRIYRRLTDTTGADGALALPAPAGVQAEPGAGHIRLSWDPVPGAAGYVIERTGGDGGAPRILRHGGSDVPAVVGPLFGDTGVADGVDCRYRIGAVAGAEYPVWSWSEAVWSRTAPGGPGPVRVSVGAATVCGQLDRVWRMVGSERLSQLRLGADQDGGQIAAEFAAALRLAHADLGVLLVRAHAILHDDNAVVHRDQGTAAGEWIEPIAAQTRVALDFISTHTYGNLPLDTRPALRRHGFDGVPIWWTEWGVGSAHFGPVHDSVLGAPFILSGFHSAQGRLDAVAYWVISDHFEELGRPRRLFHNGFGLLSVGNLRKPRYWAVHLAEHLGDQLLAARVDGDGADVLVQAWAARHADGTVDILVWNGTINAALTDGDPRLDRRVQLTINGLDTTSHQARLARVDEHHSNVVAHCPAEVAWPDEELWARLRAHDELHEERLPDVLPERGTARFDFNLPLPGIARIRLSAGPAAARPG